MQFSSACNHVPRCNANIDLRGDNEQIRQVFVMFPQSAWYFLVPKRYNIETSELCTVWKSEAILVLVLSQNGHWKFLPIKRKISCLNDELKYLCSVTLPSTIYCRRSAPRTYMTGSTMEASQANRSPCSDSLVWQMMIKIPLAWDTIIYGF